MDIVATFALAAGLGLLGFVEPCTVGSTAVLFRSAAELDWERRLRFATAYVTVRTVLTGLLGIAAVLVGSLFIGFQKAMWIGLGVLYVGIGAIYIAGYSKRLGFRLASIPGSGAERKNAMLLGALFSLNIPACAAPLQGLLIGSAAASARSPAIGFALLAVFGLAISLPVAAGLLVPALQRPILSLARWSDRVPVATGALLALVGGWSILLALRTAGP